MYKSKSGFTIVELLIVIVVIAILAAITVVAFNGIQDRARVTKKQSDIGSFVKKTEINNITADSFPEINSEYMTPTQIATVLAELQLGEIADNIVAGPNYMLQSGSSCLSAPMTKESYCVKSDMNGNRQIIWWNDSDKEWKNRYIRPEQPDQEYSAGVGAFADAQVYDLS